MVDQLMEAKVQHQMEMNEIIDEKVNLEEKLKVRFDNYEEMKNLIVRLEKEKELMKSQLLENGRMMTDINKKSKQ
jgi:hypothetical protein